MLTMKHQATLRDTGRAADEAQIEALRRMGPGGRLRAGLRFSGSMVALSRAALRARHPGLDERAVRLLWIEQNYGAELARGATSPGSRGMDEHDDLVVALTPVIDVLDRLGVAWYVGGSVASTVHGRFRATNDVDVIANLRDEHASQLRAELEADHYVDEESIRDAVRHQSSFNIVHFETGLKIDVFVATDSEYEAGVRARRVSEPIGDAGSTRRLWIASAEDTILAKLGRYQRGGGVSERQWRDVQGVIELRGSELDMEYLRRWAPVLGIAELLEQALAEECAGC